MGAHGPAELSLHRVKGYMVRPVIRGMSLAFWPNSHINLYIAECC